MKVVLFQVCFLHWLQMRLLNWGFSALGLKFRTKKYPVLRDVCFSVPCKFITLLLCSEGILDGVNKVSFRSCAEVAVVATFPFKMPVGTFFFFSMVSGFLAVCSAVRSWSLQLEVLVEKFVVYTIESLPAVHMNFWRSCLCQCSWKPGVSLPHCN